MPIPAELKERLEKRRYFFQAWQHDPCKTEHLKLNRRFFIHLVFFLNKLYYHCKIRDVSNYPQMLRDIMEMMGRESMKYIPSRNWLEFGRFEDKHNFNFISIHKTDFISPVTYKKKSNKSQIPLPHPSC